MGAHSIQSVPRTVVGNNRYELIEVIGEGGMAFVWKAFDRRLEGPVALKWLKREIAEQPRLRARFVHEARTMRRLRSPNIVSVIDVVDDGDECFMVMDYIDGVSAKEGLNNLLLRGKSMRPEQVIRVAIEVLNALITAHEAGVVHCDIKPENVIVARDGRVMVMDFGVAHIEGLAQTKTGEVLGSVAYLAPEILEDAGYVSEPSRDIFAVGCFIYELLTGDLPTNICLSVYEPWRLDVLPAVLRPIVLRATHRVRTERYQSAVEMLGALEAVLEAIEEDAKAAQQTDPHTQLTPPEIVRTPEPVVEEIQAPEPAPEELPPRPLNKAQLARKRLEELRATAPPTAPRATRRRLLAVAGVALVVIGAFVMWPAPQDEPVAQAAVAVTAPKPEPPPVPVMISVSEPTVPTQQVEAPKDVQAEIVRKSEPVVEKPTPAKASTKLVTKPLEATPPADTTPRIVHTAPATAVADSTVTVMAKAQNASPTTVTLRYRPIGTAGLTSAAMRLVDGSYRTTIAVPAGGIEYYIEATLGDGTVIKDGSRTSLHRVTTP